MSIYANNLINKVNVGGTVIKQVYLGATKLWPCGKLVAVGYYLGHATSEDGITWGNTGKLGTSMLPFLRKVVYGNGKFVTFANSGAVYYSTDGITWTVATLSTANSVGYDVIFANGKFYLTGQYYSYYSTDGVTWVQMTGTTTSVYPSKIAYGNGLLLGLKVTDTTFLMRSTDGVSWTSDTSSSVSEDFDNIVFGNGKFLATAGSKWYYTTGSGSAWTAISQAGISFSSVYSIVFCNNTFIVVDQSGYVYTSSDCVTWVKSSTAVILNARSITYTSGKYIAVGASGISYYSTDAVTWTASTGLDTTVTYNSVCCSE